MDYTFLNPNLAAFWNVGQSDLTKEVNEFLKEQELKIQKKFGNVTKIEIETSDLVISKGSFSNQVNCAFFWTAKVY